jgi:4-hydroxy-tetrahydrodipicolinate reductase
MKIALLGYGRMGQLVEELITETGEDEVVYRIHRENASGFRLDDLKQADVAIDFSLPEAATYFLPLFFQAGVPVASGTTGWKKGDLATVHDQCRQYGGAFLYAPNFSIGVNVLFAVNAHLATIMDAQQQYDVSIEETHHIHKKDAPSGTAKMLAEQLIEKLERKKDWANEKSEKNEILEVISHREDEVPGTHVVSYGSPIDTISIKHEAKSRKGFASGAIQAAKWLKGKQGIFTMQDVLGLNVDS